MNYISYFESSVGALEVVVDERYILSINFVKNIKKDNGNALSKKCVVQLKEYFLGKRKAFDLPIKLLGTVWQNTVWQKLSQIPYGTIISYQDLATMTGNPKSARAVGQAVNKNKLAIIIPCHRVLGSKGKLTGYAGGLDKKEKLLNIEKPFD